MADELHPSDQRLSELLDELHAPPSMSYFADRIPAQARFGGAAVSERRRGWRDGAGAVLVALAVAGAVTWGYFNLRGARPALVMVTSAWHVVATPHALTLNSIACIHLGGCWAVGTGIEHNSGAGWTAVPSPTPTGGVLNSITCVTESDCWAVGAVQSTYAARPLIEHFSGSAWVVVSGPDMAPGSNGQVIVFDAVTCVTSIDCWAVGTAGQEGGSAAQPLISNYSDSGWRVTSGPRIAGPGSNLNAVTCVSGDDCWAVGKQGTEPLVEHYASGGWSVFHGPQLTSLGGGLSAVTCVGAGECWAVGSSGAGISEQPLIERYAGGQWMIVSSPRITAPNGAELDSVACTSSLACWTVGDFPGAAIAAPAQFPSPSPQHEPATSTLLERYSVAGWTAVTSPPTADSSALTSVTCAGATQCWAVGGSLIATTS